ncbi:MAG: dihydroorotate dehydrogenase-like protein [Deltaproteobacteria bacterium]|nr:MAG: dihydroorotate dehydrogenase-like protein [Deltaproteobacteria bacterium]
MTMDLTTTYMGIPLSNPLMPGAGPMADDLDTVKRLEDAGAPAIVMRSLFEEQLEEEQIASHRAIEGHSNASAEASSFLPAHHDLAFGPDSYLEQLRHIKEAVDVPVFGSLNGTSAGGWLEFAKLMEEAGAAGIELNVYQLSTDPADTAEKLEKRIAEMVTSVKKQVSIPVAVKLSPFFTSLVHFAQRLDDAGADALILFNRFYQPDINVEELEVEPRLQLSTPSELLLRLRWLAAVSGNFSGSLVASGGVHDSIGALKAVMSGAHVAQVVSALLMHGPGHLTEMRQGLERWLEEHEYESLRQAHGSMNLQRCPDPRAFTRANYIHVLGSWRPD